MLSGNTERVRAVGFCAAIILSTIGTASGATGQFAVLTPGPIPQVPDGENQEVDLTFTLRIDTISFSGQYRLIEAVCLIGQPNFNPNDPLVAGEGGPGYKIVKVTGLPLGASPDAGPTDWFIPTTVNAQGEFTEIDQFGQLKYPNGVDNFFFGKHFYFENQSTTVNVTLRVRFTGPCVPGPITVRFNAEVQDVTTGIAPDGFDYKVTDAALATLAGQGVPQSVRDKLLAIKDQNHIRLIPDFDDAVRGLLTVDEYDFYRGLIFEASKYAAPPGPEDRLTEQLNWICGAGPAFSTRIVRLESKDGQDYQIVVSGGINDTLGIAGSGRYRILLFNPSTGATVGLPAGAALAWKMIPADDPNAPVGNVGSGSDSDPISVSGGKFIIYVEMTQPPPMGSMSPIVTRLNQFDLGASRAAIVCEEDALYSTFDPDNPTEHRFVTYERGKVRARFRIRPELGAGSTQTLTVKRPYSLKLDFDPDYFKVRLFKDAQDKDGVALSKDQVHTFDVNGKIEDAFLEFHGKKATKHDEPQTVKILFDYSADKQDANASAIPSIGAVPPLFDLESDGALLPQGGGEPLVSTAIEVKIWIFGGPIPDPQESPSETRGTAGSGDRRGHSGSQPTAGSAHVYFSTGEAHVVATDLFAVGPYGLDAILQRSYRSRLNAVTWLGRNWTVSFLDERIEDSTDEDTQERKVYVYTAAGRVDRYVEDGGPEPLDLETSLQKFKPQEGSGLFDRLECVQESNGRPKSYSRLLRDGEKFEYGKYGLLTKRTSRFGKSLRFDRDVCGRLNQVMFVSGTNESLWFSLEYNEGLQLLTGVTDRGGRTAFYDLVPGSSNDLGNVTINVTVGTPASVSMGYTYTGDDAGLVESVTDGRGNNTLGFTYNGDKRVTAERHGPGTWTYNINPGSAQVTDRRGNTSTYAFAGDNTVTSMQVSVASLAGGSATTSYAHDNHNLTSMTLPEGNSVSQTFNGEGQMTGRTRTGVGGTLSESFTYGTFEEFCVLKSRTDARGKTTSWQYDSFGRVVTETQPTVTAGTPTITYTYADDGVSRPSVRIDPNGVRTEMSYSEFERR